jgi:hypothetical protein
MTSRILVTSVVLLSLAVGTIPGQTTTGTITGTVKDGSGAVVPGTQVVVLNEDTGLSRTLEADASGRYSALSLNLGSYRVTASHEGFQTQVRTGIVLTIGREAVVDLSLEVGTTSQTVEVAGEAPLVESTTASLGSLVDARTIRSLPLNGRSYDQLALLQPGVSLTSPGPTGGSAYAFGTGRRFTVGGQRPVSNSFLLDGTNVNDQGNGTPGGAAGTNLGVDTILEFKVFTNSFKAEYGKASGSVISAVTRSGTNALHGTAFEYLRNSALDARNFFDVTSSPPSFRRNQFGGVLGGPIKKDKTFFFGGYEGFRQGLATTQTANVPTVNARQGILPNGTIPVNPVVVPYLNLYPLPNGRDFGDGTAQFLSAPLVPTNEDNVMGRVDHQLTAKTNLFGRYAFDTDSVSAQQSIPINFLLQTTRRHYATLQTNSILSPRALNSFRFAVNRTISAVTPLYPVLGSSSVPPPTSFIPGQELGAITVAAGGGAGALTALGTASGSDVRNWAFTIFQWADDFSYVVGKHSLKTGVDIQRMRDNTASTNFVRGSYGFASLGAFLAGTPANFTASWPVGVFPDWGHRQSIFAVYAQDDYTVNSRLTLNFGLRWETATDPKDARGQMSQLLSLYDPAMTVTDQFFRISKKTFEPRFGLAWRLNGSGKTVLRAGGGIYHNQILPYAYGLNVFNPPFYGRFQINNPPFPNGYTVLTPNAPLNATPFTPEVKTPTNYQYNLSIQQQLLKSTVLQLAYVGNMGRHLQTEREYNTPTPTFINGDLHNPFYPAGAPRINPVFGAIQLLEMSGNSSYNAMTVSLRKQSSAGFQGQIGYTYSKSMDHNSSVSQSDSVRSTQEIMNPFDRNRDWALSDFDVRHAVVGSFSYLLPFRVASKALGAVVNGWTLDGIVTLQSGQPFTGRTPSGVGSNVSRDGSLFPADRPNLKPGASTNPTSGTSIGCTGLAAGTPVGTVSRWYDPCAFSLPLAGTYGNLGRNTIIGPGLMGLDSALEKNFKLSERANATFKFEMFNILNHANFGLPNTTALTGSGAANASAGIITYTLTTSRQLQFALRISF